MPELSDAEAIRAGQYVRCSKCGRWVVPSDPAWLPDEDGRVECSLCVTGIDFGPGVAYPCLRRIRTEAKAMTEEPDRMIVAGWGRRRREVVLKVGGE